MPLPFIPLIIGGIAAVAGVTGAAKTVSAIKDNNEAKDYNESSNRIIKRASEATDSSRKNCNSSIETLGTVKARILNNEIMDFVNTYSKLKNVKLNSSVTDFSMKFDEKELKDLKDLASFSSSIASGALSGGVAGAAAAFGASSAVSLLGTASTGVAISGLSGAAATNATLAWLGGGSLATGGLGVAGGTMVLGGIVAAPALLVLGCFLSSKASANLDRARENYSKAREYEEEMNTLCTVCNKMTDVAKLFTNTLENGLADPLGFYVGRMKQVIACSGTNYQKLSSQEQATVMQAVALAKAVKAIIDTPLINEEGALTAKSENLVEKINGHDQEFKVLAA